MSTPPGILGDHAALLCDIDGVVVHGSEPIESAICLLKSAAEQQVPVAYVTNNASKTPEQVATKLVGHGLSVDASAVMTSAVGTGELLARHDGVRTVLIVGGEGLHTAVTDRGFSVTERADDADAVAVGYGPDVRMKELAEATLAVRAGATFIASNTDASLPTERGPVPGAGTLVGVVATTAGASPRVAGKPEPLLYELVMERLTLNPDQCLAVGDRLETDILGANRAGCTSVLTLTGVHGLADAVLAEHDSRPQYVVATLASLLEDALRDGGAQIPAGDATPQAESNAAALQQTYLALCSDYDAGRIDADEVRRRADQATKKGANDGRA